MASGYTAFDRNLPNAYLITFRCYGTYLPGEEGTVDNRRNHFGGPAFAFQAEWRSFSQAALRFPPYKLDAERRELVLKAVKDICKQRHWDLFAAHVRTTHVHNVVRAPVPPERVMTALKAFASATLNRAGFEDSDTRRWARHGSTRYLWTKKDVAGAVHYVVDGQGEPMAVYAD